MSKYVTLSHIMNEQTLGYGGKNGLEIEFQKEISKGESNNNSCIKINSHISTHIDFPFHYCEEGAKLEDFDTDFFIFDEIEIVELENISVSQIISPEDLIIKNTNCEILLIKTGFEKNRKKNVYWQQNPGISPESANYLRQTCPNLRVIGFDFISISPFQNRELGRESHKAFLCSDKSILIIEDMSLMRVNSKTKIDKIFVAPLLINGLEASPVNVLGVLA